MYINKIERENAAQASYTQQRARHICRAEPTQRKHGVRVYRLNPGHTRA